MEEWGLFAYLVVTIGLFAGGFTKGFSGIGLPLMAVPVMSLAIDLTLAVALMPIPIVITNIWQIYSSTRLGWAATRFWLLLVCIPVGTFIGVKILSSVDPRWLAGIIGSITVVFSVLTQFKTDWHLSDFHSRWLAPIVGFTAGLIGGISSFFAPPLVMYLMALQLSKEAFVGAIGLMYLIGAIPMVFSLAYFDVLGPRDFLVSTLAAVPVFLGQMLGQSMRGFVADEKFRRVVLAVLLLAGLNLVRRAFAG